MHGYAGKILTVDLSNASIAQLELDPQLVRQYIGGLGIGTRLFLDLIQDRPHFDALAPENPFILMTCPLNGVKMHAVPRWTVGAKSPLTGFWGDANVGGFFGAKLKFAGYDGIVITGAAEHPTYLHIDDGQVELRDASPYWGQDIYTVTDRMIADHKNESPRPGEVLTIGPAGENLVRFATITNRKGHTAGRTGLGAVWGSKKLKAMFVRGDRPVSIAHPHKFKELRQELNQLYQESFTVEVLREAGTPAHLEMGQISGDIPIQNWLGYEWDEMEKVGPAAYLETMLTGHNTCYACGVACKREAQVKEGPFQFDKGPGPEYETICSFGPLCLNSDLQSIGKANELCNRYGMDTITCGATIAFAIECYENGLISQQDTDGLQLTWGNAEAIVALVDKIGRQAGFGALLAKGSQAAAQQIGGNAADFLTTVKGLEAPMHDPRSAHGQGLAYAVSPRGACHNASLQYPLEGGTMYLPELGSVLEDFEEMDSNRKAEMNILSQDYGMFFNSCAGFCMLGSMVLSTQQAIDLVNSVTGFDYSLDEVCHLGQRVWFLKRGLSHLFGATAEHDRLPQRLMTPLPDGPTQDSVPDMDKMLREYYTLRKLEPDGHPSLEALQALGLDELARALYPQ